MNALDTYKSLPHTFKNTLKYTYSLVPLRLRLGNQFFTQLKFLEESQWWSEQELENYQNEELRKLVRHAYANVPYYNSLFKTNNLTPEDIKGIYDLPKLPVLTKDKVRNNFNLLQARNFNDNQRIKLSTSGTTGKPVILYYDRDKDYLNFDPFVWRFFGWAGHKVGQLRAAFSRWLVAPDKVFSFNPVRNIIGLSTYKLNADRIREYERIFKKNQIDFIDGYPSMIELFTNLLKEFNIAKPSEMKGIFSHSEHLYERQRKTVEEYWGCKCFDWYGLEEKVIMGIECEQHSKLHLCSEFGVTEFIDSDVKGFKQIIATSLTNYAMPLIRYDTGDLGSPVVEKCKCGRGLPLFSLSGGREREFVLTKDGSYVSATTLEIAYVSNNIKQFQYLQTKKGILVLNIVKKDNFSNEDYKNISSLLKNRFNDNMDLEITFVNNIFQTENRKTPLIINQCN